MPICREHRQQANHNRALYDQLRCQEPYRDWAVVTLQYASLHLLDAFLSLTDQHPQNHQDRKYRLRSLRKAWPGLSTRLEMYAELLRLSHKARYECREITRQDLVDAARLFPDIERWVDSKLNARGMGERW